MTEERLHGGIVPAVALSRHGLLEAYLFNSSLEPRIRVVKTLVRMDGVLPYLQTNNDHRANLPTVLHQ